MQSKTFDYMKKPYHETPLLALIISMPNDHTSTVATRRLMGSIEATKSNIDPVILPATTPDTLDEHLARFGKSVSDWTYPSSPGQVKYDIASGMELTGYNAKDLKRVIACLVSHMRAWEKAIQIDSPIMVLEHDAVFTRKFQLKDFASDYIRRIGIVGLNDPIGATRKARVFDSKVKSDQQSIDDSFPTKIYQCPWVDDDQYKPQGLAGNSAYIITPKAAIDLLNKIDQYGLWPNDAIMCKQFFPYLYVAYPYYTKVQGTRSTTQG